MRTILFVLLIISSAPSSIAQTAIRSEFVTLKTADGITLHGALWTPASGKPRVGIVIAAGADSEFYSDWHVWLGEHLQHAKQKSRIRTAA